MVLVDFFTYSVSGNTFTSGPGYLYFFFVELAVDRRHCNLKDKNCRKFQRRYRKWKMLISLHITVKSIMQSFVSSK